METTTGTKTDDVISGTSSNDVIVGLSGDDTLFGEAGDDVLQGGRGDDVLAGGAGDDNVHGGEGDDVAVYVVDDNVGAEDRYYGGGGTDTLRIVLSSSGATPDIQADLERFQLYLDSGAHGTFSFSAFDLTVQGFEALDIVVPPPLFTENMDTVDFNTLVAGTYLDGTQYDALAGDDVVVLPADAMAAADSGYAVGTAFDGGDGNDTITGGALDDEINGGNGDDVIYGGDGNDILRGQGGEDELYGQAGDDVLGPGFNPGGTDILDGGDGNDTASFRNAPVGVDADLVTGIATRGTATTLLTSIENINGSDFADSLRGDGGDNVLRGFDGDDVLLGRGGNDSLFGGDGDDLLGPGYNPGGTDILDGGAGNDTVSFANAPVAVDADLSTGIATRGTATTLLSNIENVNGTEFNDTITGDAGDNILTGGNGDDIIMGGDGNDLLIGGPVLTDGDDLIYGGNGDDTLRPGHGDGLLDGGAGNDTAAFINAMHPVVADLVGGHAILPGGDNILVDIENLTGTDHNDVLRGDAGDNILTGRSGDDTLVGRDGNDVLIGGDGDDVLSGGDGNDVLDGGFGFNLLRGGAGNDTLIGGTRGIGGTTGDPFTDFNVADYRTGTGAITATLTGALGLGLSTVVGNASVGADTLIDVESVRGTAFDDTFVVDASFVGQFGDFVAIRGEAGNDTITGNGNTRVDYNDASDAVTVDLAAGTAQSTNAGDTANIGIDTFTGVNAVQAGNFDDTLLGTDGSGFESFRGRGGNDFIDGGVGGADMADYRNSVSGINADLSSGAVGSGTVQDGWGGTDTVVNIERVRGSEFNDTITMDDGDNRVIGVGGDDTIDGLGGNDLLQGGEGDDTLIGGDGNDTLEGDGGDGDGPTPVGNDTLIGGAGDDTLIGGAGDDTLIGGLDDDLFIFRSGDGADTVNGFQAGAGTDDVLDVSDFHLLDVYADFNDFIANAATEAGGTTTLQLDVGDSVQLTGVAVANLHADDFLFA